jgi:hypothetical protein
MEAQTRTHVYERFKHIHLASVAIILLCYMLSSYT